MNRKILIALIGGLLIGSLATHIALSVNSSKSDSQAKSKMMSDSSALMVHNSGGMMSQAASLENMSGDEFDKAFLEQMIIHHQGAIDMAVLIDKNTKREELRELAKDIISAQTGEIEMMQKWQKDWGYKN